MRNKTTRIAIIGSLPPPQGGITTHIDSFYRRVGAEWRGGLAPNELSFGIIDPRGSPAKTAGFGRSPVVEPVFLPGNPLRAMRVLMAAHIVHLHVSVGKWTVPVLALACRLLGKRFILTIHHGGIAATVRRWGGFPRRLWLAAARSAARLVFVSASQQGECREAFGIRDGVVLGSYIATRELIEVRNLRAQRRRGERTPAAPITLVTSGYGKAYYNFDRVIAAAEQLRESGRDVRALVFVYGDRDSGIVSALAAFARKHAWLDVRYDAGRVQFIEALADSDIYVRATTVDSYGLAVAEAISLGVSAVATNVCARPAGTVVYDVTAENGLYETLVSVLAGDPAGAAAADAKRDDDLNDAYPAILSMYRMVVEATPRAVV